MVQRYIEGGYGASEMEEDEHGDWVSYEDYSELKQTLAAARTYVNDAAKTDAHAFGLLQAINKVLKND